MNKELLNEIKYRRNVGVETGFRYSVRKNESLHATVGRICYIREAGDYLVIGLIICCAFHVLRFCSVERQDYL